MDKKLYNLQLIEMMSGGNKVFINKMVNLFIELTPNLLNRIKTGLNSNDHNEIKAASHKMTPSIDMMEITTLKSVIRNIERMAIERADFKDLDHSITYLEKTINKVIEQLKVHLEDPVS